MEESLIALVETVCSSCFVDRSRIVLVGSSMGAYAALELCARRPGSFAAAALIAAHYELDPMEPLVARLTEQQKLPMWFFHAENDGMCPHSDIQRLVTLLRARSKSEVRFTSYIDTWSTQGHCADRVALWAPAAESEEHADDGEQAPAHGEELFTWLSVQRLGASAEQRE
eukprot:TRINITY_DN70531_c0_g1_i1.p1 TRINITY_DN70531_c0_g1~~TRINITY_DN70531_c0_g1_i1.p1  ORF type:complete len:170 (+),score=34.39 TRINITY_DN70531_c0_g1_i1:2-511(+)